MRERERDIRPHLSTYEVRWFCQRYQAPKTRSLLLSATALMKQEPHKTNPQETWFFMIFHPQNQKPRSTQFQREELKRAQNR